MDDVRGDVVRPPQKRVPTIFVLSENKEKNYHSFYAPNFEKVGHILVSACPYVCVCVGGGGGGIEILS